MVAALVLVATLAGCGASESRSFALVGDSLAVRISCPGREVSDDCLRSRVTTADGPLMEAMSDRYDVRIDAEGGRRFRQVLDRARALADDSPEVMAENLGTNDSILGNTGWKQGFDELLAIMLRRPCAVLTTVALGTELRDPHDRHIATQVNAAIAEVRRTEPRVRVVDWAAAVGRHGTAFSSDGFHPTTPAGRAWLADAYRAAADSCPPAR